MCEQHKKAFINMRKFIAQRRKQDKPFTIWELEQYVIKEAQTTRIAPGRSVRDWIEDAKERGKVIEVAPLEYVVR